MRTLFLDDITTLTGKKLHKWKFGKPTPPIVRCPYVLSREFWNFQFSWYEHFFHFTSHNLWPLRIQETIVHSIFSVETPIQQNRDSRKVKRTVKLFDEFWNWWKYMSRVSFPLWAQFYKYSRDHLVPRIHRDVNNFNFEYNSIISIYPLYNLNFIWWIIFHRNPE